MQKRALVDLQLAELCHVIKRVCWDGRNTVKRQKPTYRKQNHVSGTDRPSRQLNFNLKSNKCWRFGFHTRIHSILQCRCQTCNKFTVHFFDQCKAIDSIRLNHADSNILKVPIVPGGRIKYNKPGGQLTCRHTSLVIRVNMRVCVMCICELAKDVRVEHAVACRVTVA